jgi:non-specific protein-tyrosine kinase
VRLEQAIQPWAGGAFDVLASGPLPPNPSELLASQHMKVVLAQLRDMYDVVLIDSPPLLPVTDAAAVAPATDGVILVCRSKETTRDQVTAAVEALDAVSARILGTVFTMVPSSGPQVHARSNAYDRTDQPSETTVENRQTPARHPERAALYRPSPSRGRQ